VKVVTDIINLTAENKNLCDFGEKPR